MTLEVVESNIEVQESSGNRSVCIILRSGTVSITELQRDVEIDVRTEPGKNRLENGHT